MKYILIATEAHTMPYAIKMSDDSVEKAMDAIKALSSRKETPMFQPQFLIDLDAGDVQRVIKSESGYALIDRAFESNLGIATPDEYFAQEIAE